MWLDDLSTKKIGTRCFVHGIRGTRHVVIFGMGSWLAYESQSKLQVSSHLLPPRVCVSFDHFIATPSVYLTPEMSWDESLYFWLFARITRKIANPIPTTATTKTNNNISTENKEEKGMMVTSVSDGSLWTAINQQTLQKRAMLDFLKIHLRII